MKVLIIGAAGKTGLSVVNFLLADGHQVSVFVHKTNPFRGKDFKIFQGDASDILIMDDAMKGQHAVIYTMGGQAPTRASSVEAEAMANIISAMHKNGTKRLIAVTMLGLGESSQFASTFSKIFYSTFLRGAKKDKTALEQEIKASNLNWTIVRPPRLTEENPIGHIKIYQNKTDGNAHRISRKDLARFLVDQLEKDTYLKRAVTIATS